MLGTTRRRAIAATAALAAIVIGVLSSKAIFIFAGVILTITGAFVVALGVVDWCGQADEDIEAARREADRRHARGQSDHK